MLEILHLIGKKVQIKKAIYPPTHIHPFCTTHPAAGWAGIMLSGCTDQKQPCIKTSVQVLLRQKSLKQHNSDCVVLLTELKHFPTAYITHDPLLRLKQEVLWL